MTNKNLLKSIFCCAVILISMAAAFAQKRGGVKPAAKPKTIVFAVLDSGKTIEPIAAIEKGELVDTSDSSGDEKAATAFSNAYYKPKTTYDLIFGGAANGTITIKSSNPKSECGKNLADVSTISAKAKMSQWIMGLAVNSKTVKAGSGVRRLPTATERAEIESLVRAEFIKQGVSDNVVVKNLKYYNLTALDVDNDGKAEMVGSFWVETSAKERNLLFFIAEKDTSGKYKFGFSEYNKVTPDQVMSGDLKNLDDGIGAELLLDVMEYNGDTTAEIFTINKAFEGNNFHVYSRKDGKWTRVFEGYNYHCAY